MTCCRDLCGSGIWGIVSGDTVCEGAQAGDLDADFISGMEELHWPEAKTDSHRGASRNDIAGLKCAPLRQRLDKRRNTEDHHITTGFLAFLPVDESLQGKNLGQMLVGNSYWAHGTEGVTAFANVELLVRWSL